MDLSHYDLLADLFVHPGPGFIESVDRAASMLAERYPTAAVSLEPFRAALPRDDVSSMQELHARTFDVQAITTLDIGYVLFGEDYKRGELLANLSREHREAGVDCRGELGDHLPNLLRLLPRLSDHELRLELVTILIDPALKVMITEFASRRLEEKDLMYRKHHKTVIDVDAEARTIHCGTLEALREVLRLDFELDDIVLTEPASEFVIAVGTEMTIEGGGSCSTCT